MSRIQLVNSSFFPLQFFLQFSIYKKIFCYFTSTSKAPIHVKYNAQQAVSVFCFCF